MRCLVMLGLCLMPFILPAQMSRLQVATDYSDEISSNFFEAVIDSVGTYNGYTYFVTVRGSRKRGTQELQLRGLNAALSQHSVVSIPLTYDDQNMDFVRFTLHEGKGRLYTAFLNERSGKEYLLRTTVDVAEGTTAQEPEVLLSIDGASDKNRANWAVLAPTAQGKQAVSYYTPGRRRSAQSFSVTVFGTDGQPDFTYVASNPSSGTKQNYVLWDMDVRDNLYLTFSEQDDDGRRVDVLERDRAVVRVSGRGTQVQRQTIQAGDYLLGAPRLSRASGQLTVAGTYADRRSGENLGVYIGTFQESDLSTRFQTTVPITEGEDNLPTAAVSADEAGKGLGKYLKRFQTVHLSITPDGGGYLVGEGYFREAEKAPVGQSVQWVDTYLDLLVIRFTINGSVEWVRCIPRHTAIVDELHVPLGGTFVHTRGNKLFIAFNDDAAAVGQYTNRAKKKFSHINQMLLRCIALDPTNRLQEGTSNEYRQSKHILPAAYAAVDPQTGDIIYIVTKRLNQKFARLSFTSSTR